MSATYCVGDFARRLGRVPATSEAFRAEIERIPETCDRDCSPGGCRAHCREYATGMLARANSPFTKPAKAAKKSTARRTGR